MEDTYSFAFHDQLPLVNHVVSAIMELSPGGRPSENNESIRRKKVINAYLTKLIDIWSKAFKLKNIQCRKTVKKKIHKALETYYKEVVTFNTRKRELSNRRHRQMEWRKKSLVLFDIMKNESDPNTFQTSEKNFYFDQLDGNQRKMYLSEEIDEEFEAEEEATRSKETEEKAALTQELSFIYEEIDDDECATDLNTFNATDDLNSSQCSKVSLNRSGLARLNCVDVDDASTQTDACYDRPEIRLNRNCTEKVKATSVEVSVKCAVSADTSLTAVQTVCKGIYNHEFYRTKEEALARDPSLVHYKTAAVAAPDNKKPRLAKNPPPRTKEDYIPYKNVLPTPKTVIEHKQRMAIQEEAEAANALYSNPKDVKCTLHYDTTSRSKIPGEWPAIILNFAGRKRYSLRPMFFAYEDRAQIVRLLVETLERLATLATANTGNLVSAKDLWEKIAVLMTDSVEKNLKIEDRIALTLNSQHIPLHVLCKAHTVEALDRSNLSVLENVEHKLNFREALISTAPSITPFLRGEKSVSTAAVKTIINFISHDKSATSTNQATLFDHILEREDQVKHISLYQERRFTKLGYSCASILDALPYIRMVVNETHLHNQHVEIMRVLLDAEFLHCELRVLAYFTYKVTLPLLNVVETGTQDDLCKIFPQLFKDLQNGSLDTLNPYMVKYRHIVIQEPTSEVEIMLLKEMCHDAAKTIELQCGREYGFGENTLPQRATEIHKLSDEEKKDLERNNILAERELGVFDHRSVVANSRNYKFKAKSLRNDMVLHKSSFDGEVAKLCTSILKQLNKREEEWTMEQKVLHRKKIEEKMQQARNSSQYTMKLLEKCKSWGGPVTSVEELSSILESKPDISDHIVRTELAYYRDTHKPDVIANPRLFKLNKISSEDRLSNLFVLLNGHSNKVAPIPLPNDADALAVLKNLELTVNTKEKIVDVNGICVTLWVLPSGKKNWYLGYCKDITDDEYVVEHLERVSQNSDLKWRYPSQQDIAPVDADQIMVCDVIGDWNVHADRNMMYTLRNHVCINNIFQEII